MPGTLTERELEELLAGAEIGVLCTVDPCGRPEGSPIWFEASGDRIHVHVDRSSKKARNVRRNPNVSMTVDTRVAPYRGVVLRGTVRELPRNDEIRRRTAIRYLGRETGEAYLAAIDAAGSEDSVLLEMQVTSRYSWDYGKGL